MEENTITLDEKDLKILNSKTRIKILKLLSEKEKTLTQIAEELQLKQPTVLEHLKLLEEKEYIKKNNKKNQTKRYKLTYKGLKIIKPKTTKVFLSFITTLLLGILTYTIMLINKIIIEKKVKTEGIKYTYIIQETTKNIQPLQEKTITTATNIINNTINNTNNITDNITNNTLDSTIKIVQTQPYYYLKILFNISITLITISFILYIIYLYYKKKEK